METIGCIFCKNKENDARIVIEENGFLGRKCPHCGLIYISPRPTPAEIVNLYQRDQAHASAESHLRADFTKRLHAGHSLSILERYKKQGHLLEIGAGAGYFLDEARKAGFDVYGIELNPTQTDFINRKLDIPCETTTLTGSYDNKIFDIIYHCDVISHFYDPIS